MNAPHMKYWPEETPKHIVTPNYGPYGCLLASAKRNGEKDAVIYYGQRTSYAVLLDQVEALAAYLHGLGVSKGDRVLLSMQNSPQFIIAYCAISRLRAVAVLVSPMNRANEVAYLQKDTDAEIAIVGQELIEEFQPLIGQGLNHLIYATYSEYINPDICMRAPSVVSQARLEIDNPAISSWRYAMEHQRDCPVAYAEADDVCVLPYTSGTTGQPKGCIHTNKTIMTTAMASAIWLNVTSETVQLVSVPFFHVTGMQSCMNASLWAGATMVLMTRWDRDLAVDLIETYGITYWTAISAMVIDFVGVEGLAKRDLSSLRVITGGGAAMPKAIAAQLYSLTGLNYIEGYGLSETAAPTHINPPQRPKAGCLGIPIMDVDARIIDLETLQELGSEEVGEIVVDAPQVFAGYWGKPEATEESFLTLSGKRFFRTGDIGRRDEEGYYFISDRLKRMINVAGYKVWPTEVESMMYGHPGIVEACVISAPDERRGETVKALVVCGKDGEQYSEDDIFRWCRENMSVYKAPKEISFCDSLPKSPSGKVLWRQLQEAEWK